MDTSNDKEEVTVIVPVYNRETVVVPALESIKAQTYRPIHLVVVDNGSTDGSLVAVEGWKTANERAGFKVTVVEESRRGACAARNRGVEEARGDKLIFFDSDDTMYPCLVEKAVTAFQKDPALDFVFWHHKLRLLDGKVRENHYPGMDLLECHLIHSFLCTHSFMVRKSFFLQIGGWDETLPVWNDYELGVRMLLNAKKVMEIKETLYEVVSREDSITGSGFSGRHGEWERSLLQVERDIKAVSLPHERKYLKMIGYRRIILAAHYAREGRKDLGEALRNSLPTDGRRKLLQKLLLRFAYTYTSFGGRGAWLIVSGGAPIFRRFRRLPGRKKT